MQSMTNTHDAGCTEGGYIKTGSESMNTIILSIETLTLFIILCYIP